jgi:hypothetical protein
MLCSSDISLVKCTDAPESTSHSSLCPCPFLSDTMLCVTMGSEQEGGHGWGWGLRASVAGGSFHFVHSFDMCPNSPHCQQRGRPFPLLLRVDSELLLSGSVVFAALGAGRGFMSLNLMPWAYKRRYRKMTLGSSPAQGAYRDVRPGPNSGGSPSMMNLVRSSGMRGC